MGRTADPNESTNSDIVRVERRRRRRSNAHSYSVAALGIQPSDRRVAAATE